MKHLSKAFLPFCLLVLFLSCSKENTEENTETAPTGPGLDYVFFNYYPIHGRSIWVFDISDSTGADIGYDSTFIVDSFLIRGWPGFKSITITSLDSTRYIDTVFLMLYGNRVEHIPDTSAYNYDTLTNTRAVFFRRTYTQADSILMYGATNPPIRLTVHLGDSLSIGAHTYRSIVKLLHIDMSDTLNQLMFAPEVGPVKAIKGNNKIYTLNYYSP